MANTIRIKDKDIELRTISEMNPRGADYRLEQSTWYGLPITENIHFQTSQWLCCTNLDMEDEDVYKIISSRLISGTLVRFSTGYKHPDGNPDDIWIEIETKEGFSFRLYGKTFPEEK